MESLLYLTIAGISHGAILGLGALGFVVIYKSTGMFNIAHGALMSLGAFFAASLSVTLGWPMWVALILGVIGAGIVGFVYQLIAIRPLIGQSELAILMVTIGGWLIIDGVILLVWGSKGYTYPEVIIPFVSSVTIGGVLIDAQFIIGLIISIFVIVVIALYFKFTRMGLTMRATAEDEQLAESMGVQVRSTYIYGWIIGSSCAAVGGIVFCSIGHVSYLTSEVGLVVLPVAVFGGLTSVPGAIIAGIIVGLLSTVGGAYIEQFLPGFKDIFPYTIMVLVLLILPYGLFGEKRIERI